MPERPSVNPVVISAAINGPSGFGPDAVPRTSAIIHGYQENKNARTKNTTRSCRIQKTRSEEHTSELQSLAYLVCRLLLEKKNFAIQRPHQREHIEPSS